MQIFCNRINPFSNFESDFNPSLKFEKIVYVITPIFAAIVTSAMTALLATTGSSTVIVQFILGVVFVSNVYIFLHALKNVYYAKTAINVQKYRDTESLTVGFLDFENGTLEKYRIIPLKGDKPAVIPINEFDVVALLKGNQQEVIGLIQSEFSPYISLSTRSATFIFNEIVLLAQIFQHLLNSDVIDNKFFIAKILNVTKAIWDGTKENDKDNDELFQLIDLVFSRLEIPLFTQQDALDAKQKIDTIFNGLYRWYTGLFDKRLPKFLSHFEDHKEYIAIFSEIKVAIDSLLNNMQKNIGKYSIGEWVIRSHCVTENLIMNDPIKIIEELFEELIVSIDNIGLDTVQLKKTKNEYLNEIFEFIKKPDIKNFFYKVHFHEFALVFIQFFFILENFRHYYPWFNKNYETILKTLIKAQIPGIVKVQPTIETWTGRIMGCLKPINFCLTHNAPGLGPAVSGAYGLISVMLTLQNKFGEKIKPKDQKFYDLVISTENVFKFFLFGFFGNKKEKITFNKFTAKIIDFYNKLYKFDLIQQLEQMDRRNGEKVS